MWEGDYLERDRDQQKRVEETEENGEGGEYDQSTSYICMKTS
jgi:hypothetical protein